MDRALLRTQIPALLRDHLPRSATTFSYQIYDDAPARSAFGHIVDPFPFKSTVVVKTEQALTSRPAASALPWSIGRWLATILPKDPASNHAIRTTALRWATHGYAGEGDLKTAEGHTYTVSTVRIGGAARIPIAPPRCPQLAELIEQIEHRIASDGRRNVVHLLIDAGARDFAPVDPTPAHIVDTPPSLSFRVATGKFAGVVRVIYDRPMDLYAVEPREEQHVLERVEHVVFTSLGQVLERLIDDSTWRTIHLARLAHSPKKQRHL